MTKDQWLPLSVDEKQTYMAERLKLIKDVEGGLHPLAGKRDQGKIREIKNKAIRELEEIFNWENSIC